VETAERTGVTVGLSLFYLRVGTAYEHLDSNDPKAEFYFRKSLDAAIRYGGLSIGYGTLEYMTIKLLQQHKQAEALLLMNSFIKRFPPENLPDKQTVALIQGNYYEQAGNVPAAEKHYLAAVSMEKDVIRITNSQGGVQTSNSVIFIPGRESTTQPGHTLTGTLLIPRIMRLNWIT
jgi:tetratricopeptide (TPR) repeat protein